VTIKNFTDTTPADGVPDSPESKLSLKGTSNANGIAREYGDSNPVSMSEFYLQSPRGLVKPDPYFASFDGEFRRNNYAKLTGTSNVYDIYIDNVLLHEDVDVGSDKKAIIDMVYLSSVQPVEITIGSAVGDKYKIRRRAARQLQIPAYNSDSSVEISVSDFFNTKKVTNTEQIHPDTKTVIIYVYNNHENYNLIDDLSRYSSYTTNTELVNKVLVTFNNVNIYSNDPSIPAVNLSGLPGNVQVEARVVNDSVIRGAGGKGGNAFVGELDGQAGGTAIEFFNDHPDSSLRLEASRVYGGGGGGGAGLANLFPNEQTVNRYYFGAGGGGGAGAGDGGDAQANGFRFNAYNAEMDADLIAQGRHGRFVTAPGGVLDYDTIWTPRAAHLGGAGGSCITDQFAKGSCQKTDTNKYSYQQTGCFADKDSVNRNLVRCLMSYEGRTLQNVTKDPNVFRKWEWFSNKTSTAARTASEISQGIDFIEFRPGSGQSTVAPALDRRAVSRYKCKDDGRIEYEYGVNNAFDVWVTCGATGGWTVNESTKDEVNQRGASASRAPSQWNDRITYNGTPKFRESIRPGGFGGAYGDAVSDFGVEKSGDRYRSVASMKSGGNAGYGLFGSSADNRGIPIEIIEDALGAGGGGGAWGTSGGEGRGTGGNFGAGGRGGYSIEYTSNISRSFFNSNTFGRSFVHD